MTLYLSYGAMSSRGYDREINEDSVYAGPGLLALADGVGGQASGEIASSLVIGELATLDPQESVDVLQDLRLATERGSAAIAAHVRTHPSDAGMARPSRRSDSLTTSAVWCMLVTRGRICSAAAS